MRRRQRGAAVIVAMLILALAAIAASQFSLRIHVQWRKLENAADLDQARWVLRAAEQWAAAVILDDSLQNSADHLGEAWARGMPPVEAEGFRVDGRIRDQDGRFNVNNLVRAGRADATQLTIFRRLLANLRLPTELADAVADWLDADSEPLGPAGAENGYYHQLPEPVGCANRPIVNLNELLPVRGMNARLLSQLHPYVTVLPTYSRVNVNTAAPELLAALSGNLGLDDAYALADQRDRAHFRNLGDLRNALGDGARLDERQISFASEYFLVTAQVRRARVGVGSQALYRRNGRNFPNLIWRAAL